MIEVDGSFGEGGGQVLRTSIALAAVLSKEIRILKIRAGREQPGLRSQHLTGIKAACELCSGTSKGLEIGSTELVFSPGKLRSGMFKFDVGTAGSITLVLQTIMPILAFAPGNSSVEVSGGTDVKWSPPIDYINMVTLPTLKKMGYDARLERLRRGHYPKGGGLVRFSICGGFELNALRRTSRGAISRIRGVSHATGLPSHVAERQIASATACTEEASLPKPSIDIEIEKNHPLNGPGSGIVLSAETRGMDFLGSDSLGERGKLAENVGAAAGRILIEEIKSDSVLDRHMGDMIIPYLVLATGESEVTVSRITQHAITNVKVAEWLSDSRIQLIGDVDQPGRLRVHGIGSAQERN